jgi:hypothetical protein
MRERERERESIYCSYERENRTPTNKQKDITQTNHYGTPLAAALSALLAKSPGKTFTCGAVRGARGVAKGAI